MNPYLRMDIRTTSREALVGRLLDRAVMLVGLSIEKHASHPVEAAETTSKAVDIVSELRGALNPEVAQELVENLDALYEFVNRRLVLGGIAAEVSALRDAHRVLETIAGVWSELLLQRGSAA